MPVPLSAASGQGLQACILHAQCSLVVQLTQEHKADIACVAAPRRTQASQFACFEIVLVAEAHESMMHIYIIARVRIVKI